MGKYNIPLILVLLSFCFVMNSCSFLDRYDSGFVERQQNTQNVKKLKLGMTKKQVLAIMGEPLIDEKYNKPNIWFYYTDWDWADCARTEEECTPLVFENGVLIGWGRAYYRNYIHSTWQFNDKAAINYDVNGQE